MTDYSPRQIEMINKARRIAQVSYPDFEQTKEWMLGLAEVAQEVTDEERDDYDALHEIADSEVPYMTYRLWLIWTDLQLYQEWDEWSDMVDFRSPSHDINLEQIPQIACYGVALRVLSGWE